MSEDNEIIEKFNITNFIKKNKIKLSIIFAFFIIIIFSLIIFNEIKKIISHLCLKNLIKQKY